MKESNAETSAESVADEKRKNLEAIDSYMKAIDLVPPLIPNAPLWNENLASQSEADVKADRAPEESIERLQQKTIEIVTTCFLRLLAESNRKAHHHEVIDILSRGGDAELKFLDQGKRRGIVLTKVIFFRDMDLLDPEEAFELGHQCVPYIVASLYNIQAWYLAFTSSTEVQFYTFSIINIAFDIIFKALWNRVRRRNELLEMQKLSADAKAGARVENEGIRKIRASNSEHQPTPRWSRAKQKRESTAASKERLERVFSFSVIEFTEDNVVKEVARSGENESPDEGVVKASVPEIALVFQADSSTQDRRGTLGTYTTSSTEAYNSSTFPFRSTLATPGEPREFLSHSTSALPGYNDFFDRKTAISESSQHTIDTDYSSKRTQRFSAKLTEPLTKPAASSTCLELLPKPEALPDRGGIARSDDLALVRRKESRPTIDFTIDTGMVELEVTGTSDTTRVKDVARADTNNTGNGLTVARATLTRRASSVMMDPKSELLLPHTYESLNSIFSDPPAGKYDTLGVRGGQAFQSKIKSFERLGDKAMDKVITNARSFTQLIRTATSAKNLSCAPDDSHQQVDSNSARDRSPVPAVTNTSDELMRGLDNLPKKDDGFKQAITESKNPLWRFRDFLVVEASRSVSETNSNYLAMMVVAILGVTNFGRDAIFSPTTFSSFFGTSDESSESIECLGSLSRILYLTRLAQAVALRFIGDLALVGSGRATGMPYHLARPRLRLVTLVGIGFFASTHACLLLVAFRGASSEINQSVRPCFTKPVF
ncbi:hypothetical protein HDU96_001625 [Phlyctochytrium bullatum]|nr:hypothetical protein HDU96_001625 [Phlyctochytrium bullatum]